MSTPATPPPYELQYFVVAFLDIMGQGVALNGLVDVPGSPEERDETLRVLKHTLGSALRLRRRFEQHYRTALQAPAVDVEGMTDAELEEYTRLRQVRIIQRGFSDSVVIAIPLGGPPHPLTSAFGIFATFWAIAGVSLEFLVRGNPIRGGIDVSPAIELDGGEVYGTALRNAYYLESRSADYPRVLLGDGILEYLAGFRPSADLWEALGLTYVNLCSQLSTRAPSDGRWMVHPLSPLLRESAEGRSLAQDADRAVQRMLAEHTAAGDAVLSRRYQLLADYFTQHHAGGTP